MNYKLPILAVGVCLAVTVQVASIFSSQPMVKKGVVEKEQEASAELATAQGEATVDGQELVAQAARRLLVSPGLEAKTRQSVNLFGQKLVGSGDYCQLTNGPKLYLKLDLKLQVAGEVRSLRQICDGDSLWEVHGQGDAQTFSHVNLGRLREVARETNPLVPPSFWMALGGLPRLLAKLDENFVFQAPKAITVGNHPLWSVEGQWKRELLANMLPNQREAILAGKKPRLEELPEQVPHGVTLVLGRDQIVPLFPYRFSFFREVVVDEDTGKTERRATVTWELFEVRVRADLRPSDFDYRPPDQEFQEHTRQYIDQLKAAAQCIAPEKK